MASNTPRATPARVIIVFALLAGVVVVAALRDSQRTEREQITYPTAVGDESYHQPGAEPLRIAVRGAVFTLHEEPGERLQRRDDRMWRVPLAVPVPRLYTTAESFPEDKVPPLYLKVGSGDYLRVELEAADAPGE